MLIVFGLFALLFSGFSIYALHLGVRMVRQCTGFFLTRSVRQLHMRVDTWQLFLKPNRSVLNFTEQTLLYFWPTFYPGKDRHPTSRLADQHQFSYRYHVSPIVLWIPSNGCVGRPSPKQQLLVRTRPNYLASPIIFVHAAAFRAVLMTLRFA